MKCVACGGRGWFNKHYPHTTIESLVPNGEHCYQCTTCSGTGTLQSGKRLVVMSNSKNGSHWRIYLTAARREIAIKAIGLNNLSYWVDWKDANGYGLMYIYKGKEQTK